MSQTFYGATADGYIYKYDANYATAKDAVSGSIVASQVNAGVGQEYSGGYYFIYRSFLFFDTTTLSIPDGCYIVSAKVRIRMAMEGGSTPDSDLVLQTGGSTYPHNPLVSGDFDKTHYSGDGGSVNTETITEPEQWVEIPLNADGIPWINPGGITKFCLRTSRDIDGITPTDNIEDCWVYMAEKGSGYKPELVIELNQTTVYGSNPDAYIHKEATVYATAHDAADGDSVWPSENNISIEQWHAEGYSIRRGYLFFDVPEIPGFIVSAKIIGRCAYKYTTGGSGFDLVVQNGQPTYPHNPVVVGDYDCANYSGDGGSINEADIAADTDFEIPLNNDGLSWITSGAINKFCLRLSTDIASSPPSGGTQEIAIRSADYATVAQRPRLVITWDTTSVVEGAKAGETFDTVMEYQPEISDGAKLGDSAGRKIQVSKGISEGAKLGDDLTRKIQITKAVSEGAKLGEQVDREIETEKSVAEGVKVGDSFATTANFQEGVSEGAKLGDEIEGDTPYRGAQVDGVALGDAFEGDNSNRGELYEGIKAGDAIDAKSPIYPTQTEGVKQGDTWSRKVITRKKSIAEGTKLSDALTGTISNVYLYPQDTVHHLTSDSPILEQIIISGVGVLDAELPALTCYARGGARLIADLPVPTLVAKGISGNTGLLDAILPMLTCVASAYPGNVGVLDADLPIPTLYARGSAGGRFDDYVLRYSRGL